MRNIKKIVLLLIGLVAAIDYGWAQNGFHITGHADGIAAGKLHLIAVEGNQVDTLGTEMIVNGDFEFVGNVDHETVAYLTMEGRSGGIQIILENADIMITIDANGIGVKGGEEQDLYSRFTELEQIMTDAQTVFGQKADAVARNGNEMEMVGLQKSFEKIINETNVKVEALIQENPDRFATSYALFNSISNLPWQKVEERYGWLGDNARDTYYGKSVAEYLKARKNVEVGSIAPDFTVKTPEGSNLTLHKVSAKLKLVEFWASWCKYCRAESSELIDIFKKYQPSGLQIISISMDTDPQVWKRAIGEDGKIWFNGSDLMGSESPLITLYFIDAIPHTLLLDEENRIIAKDLHGQELRKKIAEFLKKKKNDKK